MIVNPYDAEGVAEALREALDLTPKEVAARNKRMRERVMKYDAKHWARSFIDHLQAARGGRVTPDAARIEELTDLLRSAVAARKRIALFLDYDGTLREIERAPGA